MEDGQDGGSHSRDTGDAGRGRQKHNHRRNARAREGQGSGRGENSSSSRAPASTNSEQSASWRGDGTEPGVARASRDRRHDKPRSRKTSYVLKEPSRTSSAGETSAVTTTERASSSENEAALQDSTRSETTDSSKSSVRSPANGTNTRVPMRSGQHGESAHQQARDEQSRKQYRYKSYRRTNLIPTQVVSKKPTNAKSDGSSKDGGVKAKAGPAATSKTAHTELASDLIDKLLAQECECMICFENIHREQKVWSCRTCFAIFHIKCVRKWAQSSVKNQSNGGSQAQNLTLWRCPGCQGEERIKEFLYKCFCGKRTNPEVQPGVTPHSCGEYCGRSRGANGSGCPHRCVELCHPGPCPPCLLWSTTDKCHCKRETIRHRCSEARPAGGYSCGAVCGKQMSCGTKGHVCRQLCHSGRCGDCIETVRTTCWCSKKSTDMPCAFVSNDEVTGGGFDCGATCGKLLSCQNHHCAKGCHKGECEPCSLTPELRDYCACGKRRLTYAEKASRNSCLSDIPSCGGKCDQQLNCVGGHMCKLTCGHKDACESCEKQIDVLCACGEKVFTVDCASDADRIRSRSRCKRTCSDKMDCKRHHCTQECCPQRKKKISGESSASRNLWKEVRGASVNNHKCNEPCERELNCKLHKCDLDCGHRGDCGPCGFLIREPLTCFCGANSIPAPVRCGTEPPECDGPCAKERTCDHPCLDTCHYDDCQKCVQIISRQCRRHGETRVVPCFIESVTCGRPCNEPLGCKVHACRRYCHTDDCREVEKQRNEIDAPNTSEGCGMVCGLPREPCGHPCSDFCHPGTPCSGSKCLFEIFIRCSCGRQVRKDKCLREFRVGLSYAPAQIVDGALVRLACDEECARINRNAMLAKAIGIAADAEEGVAENAASTIDGQKEQDATARAHEETSEVESKFTVKKIVLDPFSDFLMDYARTELDTILYLEKAYQQACSVGSMKLRPLCALDGACARQLAKEYRLAVETIPDEEGVLLVKSSDKTGSGGEVEESRVPKIILSVARKNADALERYDREAEARKRLVASIAGRVPTEEPDLILAKINTVVEQTEEETLPSFVVVDKLSIADARKLGKDRAELTVELEDIEQLNILASALQKRKRFILRRAQPAQSSKCFREQAQEPSFREQIPEAVGQFPSAWGEETEKAAIPSADSVWTSMDSESPQILADPMTSTNHNPPADWEELI